MKIAIVTPVFPPYRGGIGTVAADDARRLRALGHEVTVFTPDYHRGYRQEEGVVRLQPWYTWGNAALVPQLTWRLRGFDIIHLHYTFYGGEIFSALASKLWKIPLVLTYHMRPKSNGWLGWIFDRHHAHIEPSILAQARAILVSSLDYATSVGLVSDKLIEAPFSVDTTRFAPATDDAYRLRFGIPPRDTVILFVGGLDAAHAFKGVSTLLEACTMLPKDVSWRLFVVGDGDRRPTFEAEARQMGLGDRVTFAGSVAYEDLPRAYKAADVHVLPSTGRGEAFGLVTLEAAATGIPSVVSDLPGMRTIVDPEVTGLWAKAGDAADLSQKLARLLTAVDERKAFGAAARVRAVAIYDAQVCTERLVGIYKQVTSRVD